MPRRPQAVNVQSPAADTAGARLSSRIPDSDAAISVRGLTKRFGDFTAVDDIDFDVARGEIFGFLGPNGAGKTTAIRMLTGTIAPSEGAALVLGDDVVAAPEKVKRRIGYMSQKFALFEDMTVDENLRFYAGVYDLPAAEFVRQREYVLRMADLVGRHDELTRNLSVGWKQRLALGAATIHKPELLFLDEPTSGVDPVARRHFWELLYELAEGGVTLFVTTHYMDEASHCGRLAFIYRGRIVAEGAPREIRAAFGATIVEVRVDEYEDAFRALQHSDEVDEVYTAGAKLHAVVRAGDAAEARARVARALGAAGLAEAADRPGGGAAAGAGSGAGFELAEVAPSIEDVFVNLVAQADAEEAGR